MPPFPVRDGVQMFMVVAEAGPQGPAPAGLVRDLRSGHGPSHLVGGTTAANVDFADSIHERFPVFLGTVVLVSFVLLVLVFRSIPVAIKARLLNLLTIRCGAGSGDAGLQDGWLGATPGPIEAFLPVMIFAIVFGLSVDYEVLLLSRTGGMAPDGRRPDRRSRRSRAHRRSDHGCGGHHDRGLRLLCAVLGSDAATDGVRHGGGGLPGRRDRPVSHRSGGDAAARGRRHGGRLRRCAGPCRPSDSSDLRDGSSELAGSDPAQGASYCPPSATECPVDSVHADESSTPSCGEP